MLIEHTNGGSDNKGHGKHGDTKPSNEKDLEEDKEVDTWISICSNV